MMLESYASHKYNLETASLWCFVIGNVLHTGVNVVIISGKVLVDWHYGSGFSQAMIEAIKYAYEQGVNWKNVVNCATEVVYSIGYVTWFVASVISVGTNSQYEISLSSEKLNAVSSFIGFIGSFFCILGLFSSPGIALIGAWLRTTSAVFWTIAADQVDAKEVSEKIRDQRNKSLKCYRNFALCETISSIIGSFILTLTLVCPHLSILAILTLYSSMFVCSTIAVVFFCKHKHHKNNYTKEINKDDSYVEKSENDINKSYISVINQENLIFDNRSILYNERKIEQVNEYENMQSCCLYI